MTLYEGFVDELNKLAARVSVRTLKGWKEAPLGKMMGEPTAPSVRTLHREFTGIRPDRRTEFTISPEQRPIMRKRLKIVRRHIPRGKAKAGE